MHGVKPSPISAVMIGLLVNSVCGLLLSWSFGLTPALRSRYVISGCPIERSRVSHLKHDPRHYDVLAELGVKPVVGYMRLIRNRRNG